MIGWAYDSLDGDSVYFWNNNVSSFMEDYECFVSIISVVLVFYVSFLKSHG